MKFSDALQRRFAARIVTRSDTKPAIWSQIHCVHETLNPHFPKDFVVQGVDIEQRLTTKGSRQ